MITTTQSKVFYIGNNATVDFPFNFKIIKAEHLQVIITEIITAISSVLVLNSDYSISFLNASGTVTLHTPLSDIYTLTINRSVPLKQETDYQNQGAFFAETHEDSFDRLTMMAQQLDEKLDRTLKIAISSTSKPEIITETITAQVLATETAKNEAVAAAKTATGSFKYAPFNIQTDNFTLTSANRTFLNVMNNALAKAFTLPLIAEGHVYFIKNIGVGILTIMPSGSNTTEVAELNKNESVILTGDAVNNIWRSVNNCITYATDAETITGAVTNKVLTPANIQAKISSETAKGIIQIATDLEALAMIDNQKALTPAKYKTLQNNITIFSYQPGGTMTEGSFVAGAWRTRKLDNTIVNNITGCSLTANQITLPIGIYKIDAQSITQGRTDYTAYKLQSISGTSINVAGTVNWSNVASNTPNIINTYITLLVETVLELQNICSITCATGFGNYGGYNANVYSSISIHKIG